MTRRSGFSGPLLLRQMFNTQSVEKQHSRRSLAYVKYKFEFRLWYISYHAFQHSNFMQILSNCLTQSRMKRFYLLWHNMSGFIFAMDAMMGFEDCGGQDL